MDEARKIEQDVLHKKKLKIPKKIFLIGEEKLNEEQRGRIAEFLTGIPVLRDSTGLRRR